MISLVRKSGTCLGRINVPGPGKTRTAVNPAYVTEPVSVLLNMHNSANFIKEIGSAASRRDAQEGVLRISYLAR